jgi:protein disulfide-isomerase A6
LLILFEMTYDLGIQKLDSLSKFLDTVLDGTADLSAIIEETKAEELVIDDKELEIERQQEAQKMALMHGGFSSFIDFEKAIKDGAGANYHESHGYAGVMGGIPEHLKKKPSSTVSSNVDGDGRTATPEAAQKEEVVEEQISEQVTLEVKNDAPVGCKSKDSASSQDGESSCTTERPKDEL